MLEAAIKRIQETFDQKPETITQNDRTWITFKNAQNVKEVVKPSVTPLTVATLTGMLDYLNHNHPSAICWIRYPHDVRVISPLNPIYNSRDRYIEALAQVTTFEYGHYLTMEHLILALMANFHPSLELNNLLQFVSNVRDESLHQTDDDGTKQTVTVRKSITTVEAATVPNPVILQPYVTFPEIKPPDVSFIFRMKKSGKDEVCGTLHETGRMDWKLNAMDRIANFLRDNFEDKERAIIY